MQEHIQVTCRLRPLSPLEEPFPVSPISLLPDRNTVIINDKSFHLDCIFPPETSQREVFDCTARSIVRSALLGYNGTVVTYGETGSGKTYTMIGTDTEPGIVPLAISGLFEGIGNSEPGSEFTLKIGYLELYNEHITDLLSPQSPPLPLREDSTQGVYIKDLTQLFVTSESEALSVLSQARRNQLIHATSCSMLTSKAYLLMLVTISQTDTSQSRTTHSKLWFVDSSGSERNKKSGGFLVSPSLNLSLSSFARVICTLTDSKTTYVPYRDSKLTRLLQESIGGNAKTALIFTISPSKLSTDETISTLRLAVRAKLVKNRPIINKNPTLFELKLEIAAAEAEITHRNQIFRQIIEENEAFLKEKYKLNTRFSGIQEELIAEMELLRENNKKLLQENEELNTKLEQKQQNIENLNELMGNLNTKITILEEKITKMEQENWENSEKSGNFDLSFPWRLLLEAEKTRSAKLMSENALLESHFPSNIEEIIEKIVEKRVNFALKKWEKEEIGLKSRIEELEMEIFSIKSDFPEEKIPEKPIFSLQKEVKSLQNALMTSMKQCENLENQLKTKENDLRKWLEVLKSEQENEFWLVLSAKSGISRGVKVPN